MADRMHHLLCAQIVNSNILYFQKRGTGEKIQTGSRADGFILTRIRVNNM